MTPVFLRRTLLAAAALCAAGAVHAQAVIGQAAPALQAVDVSGKAVNLADYKGKTVVLEWVNPGCPFVKKHYGSGNMQATQKAAAGQGVVWLTVSSTAPSHKDYQKPAELAAWMAEQKAASTLVMDDSGAVGKAWGAKTTPHLFIVNPAGQVVYNGAIDSKPSANPADIPGATNYVTAALGELKAGQPIAKASTQPYGCSIKYAS
ncbi:redoxin domain-containing protein [Inhella crocodyli]|uniref:Redoxin domain-containing protein n=1 Tax=Inhella crocodyli TaxID=2499851 RepID=A0A437LEV9_9BURK|nr:redoxin domain-containing protein [Inhella crocodyli]RVT83834.1 redoxin domain-containing protein [Inhella crocodyli]